MRLSDLIQLVRAKVADERSLYWTDVQIARELNLWQRSLFRWKANANDSYGSTILDISAIDHAAQIAQLDTSEWIYILPSWVHRVHKVWSRVGGSTAPIPLRTAGSRNGWSFHSNRGISVCGNAEAQDLRLRVCKLPSLMFRGTCLADAADLSNIVIPAQLAVETGQSEAFPIELEEGSLIGATIEVTSSAAGRDPRGVLAQVFEQSREYNTTLAAHQLQLWVKPQFPDFVKAGDTFETHSEIEDAHSNLLILRVAESLFHKTNNLAGVNVLQPQIASETKAFVDGLQPRTGTEINIMATEDEAFVRRDADRDSSLSNW